MPWSDRRDVVHPTSVAFSVRLTAHAARAGADETASLNPMKSGLPETALPFRANRLFLGRSSTGILSKKFSHCAHADRFLYPTIDEKISARCRRLEQNCGSRSCNRSSTTRPCSASGCERSKQFRSWHLCERFAGIEEDAVMRDA